MQKALVVEDDLRIRGFICAALKNDGWLVVESDSVRSGIAEAMSCLPNIVLMDLGLPDGDGREAIEAVRAWSNVPIIVLSARTDEDVKILALDAGADDYLSKPFAVGELMARVRANLRRSRVGNPVSPETEKVIHLGSVEIDPAARLVRKDGVEVHLTPREWSLLSILFANPGKVITHRHLLLAVWGASAVSNSHYTRIYMSNLRRKLEDDPARPRYLLTENAVGYRLVVEKTRNDVVFMISF
jgi:two-component system KDP operon response regulator KdpE